MTEPDLSVADDRRAALSDAYRVDRSHLAHLRVWPMGPEMELAEERLASIRAQATFSDRLAAWKVIRQAHAARVETHERAVEI